MATRQISQHIFSPWKWREGKLALIPETPVLSFVLAVYSSSNYRFLLYQENNADFVSSTKSWKEDTADDPSSKRQRHFEDEICFPGMFYDLLFKMLAFFEGLADSGDSTYKWFSHFSWGVKFVGHFSMCVQLQLHFTWLNVSYLQVNALGEWIIGIYLHEFTNNGEKFQYRMRPKSALLKNFE